MKKEQRTKIIGTMLDELIEEPQVPLMHKDPYTLLIAVLLSARCTDIRVNKITPILFAKADTPQKMAMCPIEDIQKIIKPCGLSAFKATSIVNLSQELVIRYKGKVPSTFEELESLPGVGHKTASVVMTQAFSIPAFPVDTHIFRLAHRWGLSSGKRVEHVEKDLKLLFPKKMWGKRHLQIILYARRYCPARGHDLNACPICLRLEGIEQLS